MRPIKNRHPVIDELIKKRREQGWSQTALAVRMGYSRSNISSYELTEAAPNMRFLTTWAEALGYDLALTPKKK